MASEAIDDDALDDPIAYFLRDLTLHGKSERTRRWYERELREFESFLHQSRGTTLVDATQRDCMAWIHEVRQRSSSSTVATYASYLNRFYSYMTNVGAFDDNPMTLVLEEMDESIDTNPERREISIDRMRTFVSGIDHPLDRAVILTLLKTGMRVGELSNLDLRDVHLDDSDVKRAYDTPVRGAIDERPDSLYIPTDPSVGKTYNGESRQASNKRKRASVVPIDDELKQTLKAWLAIRPDVESPSQPLFCSTSEWGRRVTPAMIRSIVNDHARSVGWYRRNGGSEENVTPHYFRHFFTTHLRDRTGDRGIVKYLRGDVADDIIDTYTHNWGDRVREVYEASIYRLLG